MTAEIELVPQWQLYAYSAIGALLLWIKLSNVKKKVHGFSDLFEHIFPQSERLQYLGQFFVFVIFGAYIGVLFVGPFTQLQAVAGGLAWSRLAAKD